MKLEKLKKFKENIDVLSRYGVEDENIDIHRQLFPVFVRLVQHRARIEHLAVSIGKGAVAFIRTELIGGIFPIERRHETVEIGAQHTQIDIVVPRDIALVAHRADQRAAVQPIANIFLFAKGGDLVKYLHLYLL